MADGKVIISTALDNTGIEKGVGSIKGSLGGLKNVLGKMGGIIAAAFSVRAIASFAKECIDLGSDLQEVQNVVDVTFEGLNNTINEFAKNAITQFGLSELAAKQYTSTMGAMLKSMGFNTDAAGEMSMELTGLAGDMASFYNLDAGDAFAKIRAGISGETEPLKQLGINLSVANLEAFALAQGITKSYNAMSQQEQAMLRYKYLLSVTADAQGDFARTSNSWANQTRILAEQFNAIKGSIGQGFINALTPVLQFINTLVASLQSAATAFQTLTAALFGKATVQTEALTSSAEAGAAAEDALADSVGGAGKAAKESLAGFDELNKLQDNSGGGGGSGGSGGGSTSITTDTMITAENVVDDTISPKLQAVIDKVHQLIEPLKNIDFSAAVRSFKGLGSAVSKLGTTIGKHLEWCWFNILVPLAKWTIEDLAPTSINLLSAAFETLNAVLDPVLEGIREFYSKLKPVAQFIQDSVITAIEWLEEKYESLADVFEEKGPMITETLANFGTALSVMWVIAEPILTSFRDLTREIGDIIFDLAENKLVFLIERMNSLSLILAGLATGDFSTVWEGIAFVFQSKVNEMVSNADTLASALGIDFGKISTFAEDLKEDLTTFFSQAWKKVQEAWTGVSTWFQETVITPIQETFAPIEDWFATLFGNVEKTTKDVFHNIGEFAKGCWMIIEQVWSAVSSWFDENVIQPASQKWDAFWNSLGKWASDTWEGIKSVFDVVAQWFEETFSEAWQGIIDVFSPAGEIFVEIRDGVAEVFKGVVNRLIGGINSVIAKPFNAINIAIRKIRSVNIAGMYPFGGLYTVSVPRIPYLAQGAVLPANKPFLAMVGDQRHGTNVEAPLATIQEAVAAVMQDMNAGNMAGHEATVAVLQEILQAVLGIEIGDETIAKATSRYQQKLAVMRGG